MKKTATLVLGATTDPSRYAFLATKRLLAQGQEVVLVGRREGEVEGLPIHTDRPDFEHVDTVTLYVGTRHLHHWYDYILGLKPRRIIYNPGTEDPELMRQAREQGIENEVACTLVMLSTGQY